MLVILTTRFCAAGERCDLQVEQFLTLAARWQEHFDFSQIDIDNNPFIAATWGITKLPTIRLVVDNQLVASYETIPSEQIMVAMIKEYRNNGRRGRRDGDKING